LSRGDAKSLPSGPTRPEFRKLLALFMDFPAIFVERSRWRRHFRDRCNPCASLAHERRRTVTLANMSDDICR
jgi:hypothetical protein